MKQEIIKDVTEAGHKMINIYIDHGTSGDIARSKKNAVTLARIPKGDGKVVI